MNPNDRKDVRRAEKAAAVEDRESAQVIVQLCETTAGRRWIWNELAAAHVFSTSYSTDPHRMAFNEGERNRGLQLLAQVMQHCPQNFTLAQQEANERDLRARSNERAGSESAGRESAEPELGAGSTEPEFWRAYTS